MSSENRGEILFERFEFRGTRIAPPTTLMIGTALLTQLIVLSGVAIIMGVAVVTMCAFVFELFLLTAVATILERGVVDVEDFGTLMELSATVLITVITLTLAVLGGNGDSTKNSDIFKGLPLAALKFS